MGWGTAAKPVGEIRIEKIRSFQSLETFPMVGKRGGEKFPTIGKTRVKISNDWKNLFAFFQ
jgi:hypothetical protein